MQEYGMCSQHEEAVPAKLPYHGQTALLLPVVPTGVAIRHGALDLAIETASIQGARFELHRAAGFHRIGGSIVVHRGCRQ